MEQIFKEIPEDFYNAALVIIFSLLIGLEQRGLYKSTPEKEIFGTDRTFTFIGILGFVLYIISPNNLIPFLGGGFAITMLFSVFYYQKVRNTNQYGITKIIIALITYCIAPLVYTQPKWLVLIIIVTVLIFVELKEWFTEFSERISIQEYQTLAKFLIIAGIILPLLPNTPIIPFITVSPYKIWLTVVVISSLSYLSYILNRYIVKKGGIPISGILGGLYSSTAATVILSKKSKETGSQPKQFARGIVFATGSMYIRILVLVFIFNYELGIILIPHFIFLSAISFLLGFLFTHSKDKLESEKSEDTYFDKNPLEIKFAILFAVLFIVFSLVTYFVIQYFGNAGINVLSLITGVTDIDPFLLNLFQGKFSLPLNSIGAIALQAILSNNVLKLLYSYFLGDKNSLKPVFKAFSFIILFNFCSIFLLWYFY
ncbi:MAG: DUF4010 domain-containing protein [Candidatus Kapabacteria bacterium]|nr:DUF4010 domain-containing protein [Candidatus Kapabacteria bacterium]